MTDPALIRSTFADPDFLDDAPRPTGPAPRFAEDLRIREVGWVEARAHAGAWDPLPVSELALSEAVGAVLAREATAPRPIPHYASSAMDGWAIAGPPPWRLTLGRVLVPGQAREIVTGGPLPVGATAVVPIERGLLLDDLLDGREPAAGTHIRRAGEEAAAGTVLVPTGTRLSPAHVAMLSIAGIDRLQARARPRIGFVLTGDEVVTTGLPEAGRVRDAFDPFLPLAAERLGGIGLHPRRVGDDPAVIREALEQPADVLVTVGGTGRSRADRLREAIGDAEIVFDGVAMRPGHPALLARLADGRPLLALPGNPLAAVAVLLSFLPPLVDALTGASTPPLPESSAADRLRGWTGGAALIPCRRTERGVEAAPATRPNMLRGLAASDLLAVVPPRGVPAGHPVPVLPLPW